MLTGPNVTAIRERRPLTTEEAANAAREVASLSGEIDELDGQKKLAVDSFNKMIAEKKEAIKVHLKRVREGEEERVRVHEFYDLPTPGMKVLWDPATLRILRREPMTEKDRRDANLDFSEPPVELLQQIERELGGGE